MCDLGTGFLISGWGWGWVLRTVSANISRSSALVFGSRGFQEVMGQYVGVRQGEIKPEIIMGRKLLNRHCSSLPGFKLRKRLLFGAQPREADEPTRAERI